MNDLDDLSYFVVVVRHNGFSAAARATSIDKTRLCRRVAALEHKLGVRLLQRNTRRMALTEAGQRFYAESLSVVEGARQAFDNVAKLRGEPAGVVRMICSPALASSYLAPLLPDYLALHPKVRVELELGDASNDMIGQRHDIALLTSIQAVSLSGLVVRALGGAARVLLASRGFLDRHGRPGSPEELRSMDAIAAPGDVRDGLVHWRMQGPHARKTMVSLTPRLQTGDLQVRLAVVAQGLGVACLPVPAVGGVPNAAQVERVLPAWSVPADQIYAIYPDPQGMLPSVRSLIDYLFQHLPARLASPPERGTCSFAL